MKRKLSLQQKIWLFAKDVETLDSGGSIRICAGEMNPVFYNHILTVLSFHWAGLEKKVDIKILAGPVLCVEDKKQSLTINSEPLFLKVFQAWLKPVLENDWVKLYTHDNVIKIEGTEITAKSITEVLSGKFFAYPPLLQNSKSLSNSRKLYWLKEIFNGPNAELFRRLKKKYYPKFTPSQWFYGIWPLFAGYKGSYEFCWAIMIAASTGNGRLIKKFTEKSPIKRERARMIELEGGEFTLPKNQDELIKNCNKIMLKAINRRANDPRWRGKKYPLSPTYFWEELYFQKQLKALKEVRVMLKEIEI